MFSWDSRCYVCVFTALYFRFWVVVGTQKFLAPKRMRSNYLSAFRVMGKYLAVIQLEKILTS